MPQPDSAADIPAASADIAPLQPRWGWVVAFGVICLTAGLLALGSVLTATIVSVFFVGVMMIAAGAAEVIGAFQLANWRRFFLWSLIGALYILAGIVTIQNPLLAAAMLTLILAAALIVSGLARMALAFSLRREPAWLLVALSGIVTLLLGLVILAKFPVSGLYILGIFLAVDLIVSGVGSIGLGLGLRRAGRRAAAAPSPA